MELKEEERVGRKEELNEKNSNKKEKVVRCGRGGGGGVRVN